MSADQASGAYLGGIGTMLEAADVCPSCGHVHSEHQFAFLHRSNGACPTVIESRFSIVSRPAPETEEDFIESAAPAPASEVPISLGSLPVPRRGIEPVPRARTLSLPFLPPPELGGIY